MSQEIYLDANATSPVMPAAIDAAMAAMREGFGNPSSTHITGLRARAMLDGVRARARRVLGAPDGKVIFTSGATEGIQTAVLSALCAVRARQLAGEAAGSLLVYGATEHKAVPQALAHWNAVLGTGLELRALPVDANGLHRINVLRELAPQAAMVCTMAANNETGVISDLGAIGAALDGARALWMVDCVQALGKLPLQLSASRIDYAPFSGHKLYAPKGIGMLYVRQGAPFTPLCMGGGQEAGDRSGTENMSGIAALGAVLQALEEGAEFRTHEQMCAMRERLAAALRTAFPGIVFNAPFAHALPTTINFSVPSVSSKEVLDLFDAAGVRVSAGSACSSASAAPSYVLSAMGVDDCRARAAVRLSFGPVATDAFIDTACARIEACGKALRACGIGSRSTLTLAPVTHLAAACSNTWIIADEGECVVIDPSEALCQRIAELIGAAGCRVRAVLLTQAGAQAQSARAQLLALTTGAADGDGLGWPAQSAPVMLSGRQAESLAFGAHRIVLLKNGDSCAYLLASARKAHLDSADIRHVFAANAGMLAADAGQLSPATLMCCAGGDELPYACAGDPPAALDTLHSLMQLDCSALSRFFSAHPDARLIDLRERYEFIAGPPATLGIPVENVPVSELASHLPAWLSDEQRPLVLYCRSGARSGRVARCLHRLGYRNAWQLSGGLAQLGA